MTGKAVENHSGKGVMAEFKAQVSGKALSASQCCLDYRRGVNVGKAHRLSERGTTQHSMGGRG